MTLQNVKSWALEYYRTHRKQVGGAVANAVSWVVGLLALNLSPELTATLSTLITGIVVGWLRNDPISFASSVPIRRVQ